ncbi:MAG: dihydropteroate synthase, partial [Candidatus Gastranaerophilales bacterium]|nr:dihydropteroate synthase [Candidatus Gastranaerophilales bacterium]
DGGEFNNKENGINHFNKLINDGADIIDLGAESTAPNNQPTDIGEEIRRIKEILPELRKNNIPISIDTRNSQTAKISIELGADIINDVSGLCYDEKMAEAVANSNSFVILTFDDEIKNNTLDNTIKGLIKRVEKAVIAGINKDKIILDAGICFNKTYEQNFELIKYADEICSLGFPVLYGISRKSFIQKATGLIAKETEFANVSLGSYLINKGVNILRVHDVLSHKIAFKALEKVL